MAKKNNGDVSYLKISFELEEGSPEWYAHKALKALGFSQSSAIRQCLGAIYGAKGAILMGEDSKARELHEQGLRLLSVLGIPVDFEGLESTYLNTARMVTNLDIEKTVQTSTPDPITDSSGLPVEDVEMDFEE